MYRFTTRPTRAPPLLLWLVGIACAIPAQAAWKYTSIDYPGATSTQVFGLNDRGEAVGEATVGTMQFGFTYNTKKATFTVLPNVPGAPTTNTLAINNAGVIAGSAGDGSSNRGIILDQGGFSFFSTPGWAYTEGRGISDNGQLVTGYGADSTLSNYVGFIYDAQDNRFIEFLPSIFTIAQGINSHKQVVGNVQLDPSVAYPGAPAGGYGFLRQSNGDVVLFRVNGAINNRGRGINNSGLITGFFTDTSTHVNRGFVAQVAVAPAYQDLRVQGDALLDVPGAGGTIAEAINNSGQVAGTWFDAAGNDHGFFATSVHGTK
jgi:uncharacterized membrane protein